MCGITGIVYMDPARPAEPRLLEDMCAVIHHRGPDEWGMWCNENVGLGMKRLRIIDLEGGYQPMATADGSFRIVFNGEIYNFPELRVELLKKGHAFTSRSDTECILHLYEEYGERCVHHLRGMFAFAIWDASHEKLFMARDRFGKKPMHYLFDNEKFVFGSEIKSILKHPDVSAEVYRPAIVNYAAYGYVPDPHTMFTGIFKLPPGHTMTLHRGKIKTEQYWDLCFSPDNPPRGDDFYIDEVDRLLHEAVNMRMISDVPLGAFLSGGIDSSLVVAMMARQSAKPVKTFSIGFDDGKYNELPYARMVAEKYGTEHYEEIVKPDAEDVVSELLNVFDEPFADSSAIPTYYVSRLARRHVTVALSGDGGDEIFAGYQRYLDHPVCQYTNKLPKLLRQIVFGGIARTLPQGFTGVNFARYLASSDDERYVNKMSGNLSALYKKVFSNDLIHEAGGNLYSDMNRILADVEDQDVVSRRQYLDVKRYLPGDILTKVDRTSMLVSLETRSPLLDHVLAEFAASIPAGLKVRDRSLKNVLKIIARRYLPEELINRRKMGFAIPLGSWINNDWHEMSEELVLGRRALQRGNFNPRFLHRIMKEHRSGKRRHDLTIWSLMVLEIWFRSFIDQKA